MTVVHFASEHDILFHSRFRRGACIYVACSTDMALYALEIFVSILRHLNTYLLYDHFPLP